MPAFIDKPLLKNETIMSILLKSSNEYVHDSFIPLKNKIFSDENCYFANHI